MTCPGSGKPVYIDYAGPGVAGGYPRCPECKRGTVVVGPGWTMPEHNAPLDNTPASGRGTDG